jgi:hypothetical protein
MVFLFPSLKNAESFYCYPLDVEIDQVILEFDTSSLVDANCDLRVCKWNNGFPDRTRPPRCRGYTDYRPIEEWHRGDKVKEVTVTGLIPADVPFRVLSGKWDKARPGADPQHG